MINKIIINFRNLIFIFSILLSSNNAFALKLSLKGLTDVIDKVAEELDDGVNKDNKTKKEVKTEEIIAEEEVKVEKKITVDKVSELVIIKTDEDLSNINIKDLKKLNTRQLEKLIINSASIGYFISGEIFEDIHNFTESEQKGDYSSFMNGQEIKGIYKIATGKICYKFPDKKKRESAVA